MDETWVSRDLPVLDTVVTLLEKGAPAVTVADVAEATCLDPETVDRALTALKGPYIRDYKKLATGGVPDTWHVTEVTSTARQAVGQWPTAETMARRMAAAFAEAADAEQDPERKSRLRQIASFLGETGSVFHPDLTGPVCPSQLDHCAAWRC